MWLPVLTLSASILMSITALLTSLEENVTTAFHFSKTPLIEADESTPNLIVLSSAVTSYAGTCALLGGAAARQLISHAVSASTRRIRVLRQPLVVDDDLSL